MLRAYALCSTVAGLAVYSVSTWATYSPGIRMTRLYWVIGMAAAIIAHGLWTYLAQHLGNEKRLMMYGLLWDIGFTVVSVVVPVLLFKLRMSPVGYVGILLIALGGLLVKQFGLLDD